MSRMTHKDVVRIIDEACVRASQRLVAESQRRRTETMASQHHGTASEATKGSRRYNWCFRATDAPVIRVQIPAYTDRWMMGDRYGTVMATSIKGVGGSGSLYLIELDKSGKAFVAKVDDCVEV